jgi:hypothetical protein
MEWTARIRFTAPQKGRVVGALEERPVEPATQSEHGCRTHLRQQPHFAKDLGSGLID